jgi:uncharacterized protein involved in high-affinity Fe2+ transport
MKKINVFLAAFAVAGLIACGGTNTSESGAAADSTAMSHEGHDHDHDHTAGDSAKTDSSAAVSGEIRPDQNVFFVNLKDGDVVASPFKVQFGVNGMTVEPAGYVNKDKGHHHLLIGHEAMTKGEIIEMNDSTRLHFGKGQTETELKLAPGKYKLTLQFADGFHQSYGPQMSKSINIEVKK